MITVQSNNGSIPVSVRCRPDLAVLGRWLADLCAGFDRQGRGIADGVTIEVGWSVLRLVEQPDGSLLVCEPDYASDLPSALRDDVSITLQVLAAQRDLLKAVGLEATPCRFDQRVVVRKGALDAVKIYADRQEPAEGDSGWYIGPAERLPPAGVDELESVLLCRLVQRRPAVMAAMALPPGCIVVWDGNDIEAVFDPAGRAIWPASA
jgi:hypothetical protein